MFKEKWCAILVICSLILLLISSGVSASFPEYDLDGQTVTVRLKAWFMGFPWFIGPRGSYHWDDPDARLQAHIDEIEEAFNCRVEFDYMPGHADIIRDLSSAVMAGDTFFDIGQIYMWTYAILATEGLLYPIGEVLEEGYWDRFPLAARDALKQTREIAGTIYGSLGGPEEVAPGKVILWDKNMFEREGLPNLHDLYYEGNWTWEAMESIAVQATRDTTGDGEIDQFGFHPHMNPLFPLTNNAASAYLEDGRVEIAVTEQAYLDALAYLNGLVQQGVVTNIGHAYDGRVAMTVDNASHLGIRSDPDDEYAFVPLPKGPAAEEHIAFLGNDSVAVLPITARQPRAKLEMFNALTKFTAPYLEEDLDTFLFGQSQATLRAVPDRQSHDIYLDMLHNQRVVDMYHFILDGLAGNIYHNAINEVVYEGASPSATMNEVAPMLQEVLNEVFDQ